MIKHEVDNNHMILKAHFVEDHHESELESSTMFFEYKIGF